MPRKCPMGEPDSTVGVGVDDVDHLRWFSDGRPEGMGIDNGSVSQHQNQVLAVRPAVQPAVSHYAPRVSSASADGAARSRT